MWIRQVLLAIIGLASGAGVAAGLFSFIVSLGVVSDFADRTHTGNRVHLYEDSIALGGMLGNLFFIYQIHIPFGQILLPVFGLLSGIFVGAYIMALAEVLNVFPIFIRRAKILKYIPYLIIGIALGKGFGSLVHLYFGW